MPSAEHDVLSRARSGPPFEGTDKTRGGGPRCPWPCANDLTTPEFTSLNGESIRNAVPDVTWIEQLDNPSLERTVPLLDSCSGRGVSASANAANGDGPGPHCTRWSGQVCCCATGTPSILVTFAVVDVNSEAPAHTPTSRHQRHVLKHSRSDETVQQLQLWTGQLWGMVLVRWEWLEKVTCR